MIDLLVPFKIDCPERAANRDSFTKHYQDKYNLVFIEDYTERALAFNHAAAESTQKYIALADIDALVPLDQMQAGIDMLEQGYDVVYPFTHVLNVHPDGRITDDWPRLDRLKCGLMVFFNREKFIAFGGENENFIGYGWEDQERYYRALNNGYKVGRIDGDCHHLVHPRTGFQNPHLYHNMHLMNKEKELWKSKGLIQLD